MNMVHHKESSYQTYVYFDLNALTLYSIVFNCSESMRVVDDQTPRADRAREHRSSAKEYKGMPPKTKAHRLCTRFEQL